MKMYKRNKSCFSLLCSLLIIVFVFAFHEKSHADNNTAILPFQVNASKDMAYLKNGIRDMLASRLAAGSAISIINKAKADKVVQAGSAILPADYQNISEMLGADYLIVGSFTSLGGGASIDAKVYASQTHTTYDFYSTAAKADDVIMAINNLAWDIGEKIFGKPRPAQARPSSPVAVSPSPALVSANRTAHPERAFWGDSEGGGSPFIRPMGIGAFGFKKSQNFRMNLQAIDVGDIDGDGQDEVVLADRESVKVYRITEGRFIKIAEKKVSVRYKVHYVSLADLNKNGKNEIYVSCNEVTTPNSFALEWNGTSLDYLYQDARYYTRAMEIMGEGMVLVGQKGGWKLPFEPGIFLLEQEGVVLKVGKKVYVPELMNLFDFVMTDIDADGRTDVLSIGQNDRIRITRQSGKSIWLSSDYFGGTKRYVGETVKELSEDLDQPERYYIPSRLIVTDLNNDGKNDIIVNKNLSSASRVFRNLKSYPSGEIHGLAWNGIALSELWHTRQIDGYIADYQLRKIGNSGKAILYVGVVLGNEVDEVLTKNESTVLMYPLDLGAEK